MPSLVGMYFGDGLADGEMAPTNFEQAKTTNEAMFAAFFHAMLAEGVALPPGAYEALFVGTTHTDEILAQVGEAAIRAAKVVAAKF